MLLTIKFIFCFLEFFLFSGVVKITQKSYLNLTTPTLNSLYFGCLISTNPENKLIMDHPTYEITRETP